MANEAKQFTIGGVTHDVMDVGARQLITQLQNAINSVQTSLNTLIGSGNVQGAIDTFNEVKAFLDGIDTDDPKLANQLLALNNAITALQTTLSQKANDADVVKSVSVNGTAQSKDTNGNVNIQVQTGSTISPASAAPSMDGTANVGSSDKYAREDHVHPHDSTKLSKSDVSVETQGDGTVDINVKDDTYTINLNHTHENMAKLVVCEESGLPSTLAKDTIYAQVDDASNPTEIETLYIAGLEFTGGGLPAGTPAITKPSGTSINLGENSGSGVSKAIEIKANSHITGELTVGLAANSDLSFDTTNLPSGVTYNSGAGTLTIAQATAIQGVNITVVYSGSGTAEIDGGLIITGGGASAKSMKVVVTEPAPIELDGVKFTGTQWLGTDYYPNPKTEFALELTFEVNSNTVGSDSSIGRVFMSCIANSSPVSYFTFYHINPQTNDINRVYTIQALNEGDVINQNLFIGTVTGTPSSSAIQKMMTPHSVLRYTVGSSNNHLAFEPGGVPEADNTYYTSVDMQKKTSTMTNPLAIGLHGKSSESVIYSRFNLTIHRLTITEDGVAVRDYVPRIKGGVTGLLDIAQNGTGLFLTSETADELAAVPLSNS